MARPHRFFLTGLIIALLGAQLRLVDKFVLNERVSGWLQRANMKAAAPRDPYDPYMSLSLLDDQPTRRTIEPPDWLGWSLLSVGAVLILTWPIFR